MKKIKVAILGVSGSVGEAILFCLEKRNFPIEQIKLLGKSSIGKKYFFHGNEITVEECNEDSFDHCDLVFGAVSSALSSYYLPFIQKAKALYIDNSGAFRLNEKVPLVIPQINAQDILNHNGIIANPNCSTILACMSIYALHQKNEIQSMIVSTYQAVSGAGKKGIEEYYNQIERANLKDLSYDCFRYPIFSNVIPQIGDLSENDFTDEEMKMRNESRKILHAPHLQVTCTCVRVPIERSHALSLTLLFKEEMKKSEAVSLLQQAQGIMLQELPMPLTASNQNLVEIGRIREGIENHRELSLFCCGDQILKGAALNAVEIAEKCWEWNLFERNGNSLRSYTD